MGAYEKTVQAIAGVIGLFAPSAAGKYMHSHRKLSAFYKAGSLKGPNGGFGLAAHNQNISIAREARIIRQRARLLVNDSPNVCGAVRKIVNNVIYDGIKLQVQNPKSKKQEKAVETLWEEWADSQEMWLLQKQVMRSLIIDGGCFCHFYADKSNEYCPLGIELLSLDRLDESINGRQENGNFAFRGIELDSHKNVAAYHIKEEDEYAYYMGLNTQFARSRRIGRENIFLVYNKEDIGQLLPVSWLHSVIVTMHSYNEYQIAEEIAAQLAASFGIFLKQTSEYVGPGLDGTSLLGGQGAEGKPLNINDFITSGRIDVLPPGTEIQVAENTRPSSNYTDYSKQCQKNASTGIGMSYESFSNDFSEASFSSVRQAILEERRNYRVMQHFMIKVFLEPVWKRFEQFCKSFGKLPDTEISVRWQKPGWSWVDPVKDAQAMKILYENRFKSGHIICAELGLDYDEVQAQLAREEERAREARTEDKKDFGGQGGRENTDRGTEQEKTEREEQYEQDGK